MINTTTGTSIENYFDWVRRELERKEYGEVSITFTVTQGQVSLVKKNSMDTEHCDLKPKMEVKVKDKGKFESLMEEVHTRR